MNYLTHFLIDHKQGNPCYNFGLALPDMINVSERGWKPENHFSLADDSCAYKIWQGFQQHLMADAAFHSSPFFVSNTKKLRKQLEEQGLKQPGIHLFFVAHVLLEIMMDRHIILTRRDIADLFYENLSLVSNGDIESFFEASGNPVPERFFEFLKKFRESRYLFKYADSDGVFFAINMLLRRTGQPEFNPGHEDAFNSWVLGQSLAMSGDIEGYLEQQTALPSNP